MIAPSEADGGNGYGYSGGPTQMPSMQPFAHMTPLPARIMSLPPLTISPGAGSAPAYKQSSDWLYGPFSFFRDFVYTDIANHTEALKYAQALNKKDDALLVAVLERLAAPGVPVKALKKNAGRRYFYEENAEENKGHGRKRNKNLINLVQAHGQLIPLKSHVYNIFELAFLAAPDGDPSDYEIIRDESGSQKMQAINTWNAENRSMCSLAYLTAVSQYVLFFALIYIHVGPTQDDAEGTVATVTNQIKDFNSVVIITVVTSLFFARKTYKQWTYCKNFCAIYATNVWDPIADRSDEELLSHHSIETMDPAKRLEHVLRMKARHATFKWNRWWLLIFNKLVNQVLVVMITCFNPYYLLTETNAGEVMLNSLALLFIIELDEMVSPTWDMEQINDAQASNMYNFITRPDEEDKLQVLKSPSGPYHYTDNDKVYLGLVFKSARMTEVAFKDVDGLRSFQVKAHRRIKDDEYDTTTYTVRGKKQLVEDFASNLQKFECMQNLKDIQNPKWTSGR